MTTVQFHFIKHLEVSARDINGSAGRFRTIDVNGIDRDGKEVRVTFYVQNDFVPTINLPEEITNEC